MGPTAHRIIWLALLLSVAVVTAGRAKPSQAQNEPPLEVAVKATYLYKFASFVEWPPGIFEGTDNRLNICVVGDDPFGDVLAQVLQGQDADGHAFALHHMVTTDTATPCHIAFLSGSSRESVQQMLEALEDQPVLTVTDGFRHLPSGSVIHFVFQEQRVRFEIDARQAERKGITISSKLMAVASKVYGEGQ